MTSTTETVSGEPATLHFWSTETIEVETPNGPRYIGICVAHGRGPKRERIRYRSPRRIREHDAYDLARSRTIHHNIWHDGSGFRTYHDRRACIES